MADKYNLASGVLTPETLEEILSRLAEIRERLSFATALSSEDRKRVTRPGDEGVDASKSMGETALRYPQIFNKELIDPEEILRDVALADALKPIAVVLSGLTQAVDDTILAARSDAYRNALQLYGMAKQLQSRIPGLSEEIAPLRDRLDRVVHRTK